MASIRLVRDPVGMDDVVNALSHLRGAITAAMPDGASVDVCFCANDDLKVEIKVVTIQDRDVVMFNLGAGLVRGYAFSSVTHGLEFATRGRHRICAIVAVC